MSTAFVEIYQGYNFANPPVANISGELATAGKIKVESGTYVIRFYVTQIMSKFGWNITITPYINGGWSNWIDGGGCEGTCPNTDGIQLRYRNCTNPLPVNGGNNCSGNATEAIPCLLACSLSSGTTSNVQSTITDSPSTEPSLNFNFILIVSSGSFLVLVIIGLSVTIVRVRRRQKTKEVRNSETTQITSS